MHGNTACHLAVEQQNIEIIKLLIENFEANPLILNDSKQTVFELGQRIKMC